MRARLWLFVVALLLVSGIQAQQDKRLIAFSETHKEWMNEEQVIDLMIKKVNFIDITDYVNATVNAPPTPSPLPNQPLQKEYLDTILPLLNKNAIVGSITTLSTFFTRYYRSDTGLQAAQWIQGQFQSMAQQAGRSDVTVELFQHTFDQPSVIATIPGSGPDKHEVVVIGGHEDSVGSTATGRSPGADDDASGTATVLEVFRVLIARDYKPNRTLKFMTYAGEEAGLLGSQAIATSFANQNINVYGVLQLDMTGYGETNSPIVIITDLTNAPLNNFVKLLIESYCSRDMTWAQSTCGYGCSDHASWNKAGYRASFPFESTMSSSNPYIHSANDLLARMNADRMLEFAKLGLGFVVEMAGRTI